MVIRGKSRGNGKQLAAYLLGQRENDKVPEVLHMRGFADPDPIAALTNATLDVATVSRSTKPFYHGILNPRKGESLNMTAGEWEQAADIVERWLHFEELPRLIVLHEKKGRTHAHVVWLRYDYQTSRLRPDSYNFYKQNSARADIEVRFGHQRTQAKRDKAREPSHRERLTTLWGQTTEAADFITLAQSAGYEIGQGLERRPYRVITPDGKSLDLVRMLDGYQKKDVLTRFRGYQLPTEATALKIQQSRSKNDQGNNADQLIREFTNNTRQQTNDTKPDIMEELRQQLEQSRKRNRDFEY